MAEWYQHGTPEEFVPSGVKALDDLILGAVNGELLLIAGNPGQGKTSLAMQWAMNTAEAGKPAGILSLEMKRYALGHRLISGMTGIPMSTLRTQAWPSEKHKANAVKASEYLASIPVYVDDRSGLNGPQVYDTVMSWKDHGIGLIIVDYIQRMGGASDSRVQQVGDAVRAIKSAAKDAYLPVIALSSLNRAGSVGNDKPRMNQLRDTGDLEFEADTILMFHYPEEDEFEDVRVCDIHIMKQRNGPTGVVSAKFNKPATRFEDFK